MTCEPLAAAEYLRSSATLRPAPFLSAPLVSTELMTIRVPRIEACPGSVCTHLLLSSRRLGADELRLLTYGTSQPRTRRVKTTLAPQMAGVASSKEGEETVESFTSWPLAVL